MSASILSHKTVMGALAFVLAAGGYGGYEVAKTFGKYGARFDARPHVVASVVDGATLIIEDGIRVRLLGVDAPEAGECFAEEAARRLSELALGREIVLEKDQTAKDGFDRLLRYAFLYAEDPEADQEHVNEALVREGSARSTYLKPNRKYLQQLQGAEREAEETKAGMWGKCDMARETANPTREESSETFSKECVIKGSISKNFTKDYFLPGCPNYKRVKVDPRKGERWFCTEKEAREAGFARSEGCNNIPQTREEASLGAG